MMCVKSVKYKVMTGDDFVGLFCRREACARGILHHLTFVVLCTDGLSQMIQRKERMGRIHGCKITKGASVTSHLFFADDSYFFFQIIAEETYTRGSEIV